MTEQTTTVTVPTELLREFCARVNYPNTPQERLKEVLQAQLPREIEEGCRVRVLLEGYRDSRGTCGKPFAGCVLVQHDEDASYVWAWRLSELERID